MGAEALDRVRSLWCNLVFHKVARMVAKEPEHVRSMELLAIHPDDPNQVHWNRLVERTILSRRSADVPVPDRWRLQVSWEFFFGFGKDDTYFNRNGQGGFDYGLGFYRDVSHFNGYGDRPGLYDPLPRLGEWIAGEVVVGEKGPRLARWFRCPNQYRLMVGLVKKGEPVAKRELAWRLYSVDGGSHDAYWVFANLLLNDDVSPFVESLQSKTDRPPHPAAGRTSYFGCPVTNDPIDAGGYPLTWLHELSDMLGAPEWWQRFRDEVQRLELENPHEDLAASCEACRRERDLEYSPRPQATPVY